ncbi:thermonuclease family protein [Novosphingobium sp. KCTC 2891]|nr:thermonuclease family protein [Novosphingobium sp. KCTC 2891]
MPAFCTFAAAPVAAQAISGPATVVDGGSLELTGTHIRLFGIDAPETAQVCERGGQAWSCGADAAKMLGRLVQAGPVDCVGVEQRAGGRLVARCRVGGVDLAAALVTAGLAVVLPAGQADYADAEQRSRKYAQGLWGAKFDLPADWRVAHPREVLAPEVVVAPAPRAVKPRVFRDARGCAIKGNRSWRGEWIYHLPGTKFYEGTRAEEFFCTEAQAQAAGYRAAVYRDN